jgi:hypothetical protein
VRGKGEAEGEGEVGEAGEAEEAGEAGEAEGGEADFIFLSFFSDTYHLSPTT